MNMFGVPKYTVNTDRLGAIRGDGGADPGLGDPRVAEAQDGGRLEADGGEEFPTEGTGETVVFLAHVECGFGVSAGDFFRDILFFYRIELVHLVLNAITIISSFIQLCEAYHGTEPHFHLWRHFFELNKIGKSEVVGGIGFMLRQYKKQEYIDLVLPDNTAG
jgi:hypothetical protein